MTTEYSPDQIANILTLYKARQEYEKARAGRYSDNEKYKEVNRACAKRYYEANKEAISEKCKQRYIKRKALKNAPIIPA